MPRGKMYMPRKDGEFIAWSRTIYNNCTANMAAWGLDPSLMSQFQTLFETAQSTYKTNLNLELRNKASVGAKNAAFAALKRFFSAFINLLEGNLRVPDDVIVSMGLRPRRRSAHQPIPVPAETPMLTAVVGQHHTVTVYVSTLQHGHPTEFLKDKKYAGFVLKYLVDGETQWQFVISTRLHYTIIFTEAEKGKYIRLQAAWVNPTMQNGPWSEEVRELIN
ncbi:MAG: hypothetical protein LBU34_06145 [Planctomycetaceae bacterium]|jgi:hypothetical protein|nr:hypothetical protein [Planctomycetaceae bacterium]